MRGLDPRIHVFLSTQQGMDGRVKPGHDDGVILTLYPPRHCEEAKPTKQSSPVLAARSDWIASLRSQ